MSIAVAGPAGPYRITAGLACGMGAGALWGLVFLAPELVRGFTPLQLAIGRYLAFGAIAAMLIAPRWRGLVRKLAARDWVALGWLALAGIPVYYVLLSAAVGSEERRAGKGCVRTCRSRCAWTPSKQKQHQ